MTRLPSLAGTTVAHYQLISLLGSGGMGEVYLATDTRLGRRAAIKVMRQAHAPEDRAADRFLREARAVANLDHPNICTLYEVGVDRDREFLAMQFIEGQTLAARLKLGPLPFAEALRIGIELTSALSYAHSKGVLHRDLKPQNVMLQPDGRVKLLDFGLAKVTVDPAALSTANTDAPLTREGVVMGTLEYMSPEQMSARALDARSDIFSLGLILYELIGGHHPYRGQTPALTMSGILTKPYPPLTATHVPQAPTLNPVLQKALAQDPADRYATAADLLVDLKRLERGAGERATAAQAPSSRLGWMLGAAALVVVALAFLVRPMLVREQPPAVPVPRAAVPPADDRTLTYWFDVKSAADRDGIESARSLGDEPIADSTRVRLNVDSATAGFLYLLDQEGDDPSTLSLVYPIAGDSVTAATRKTTSWYGFSTTAALDHLWIVWSAEPVPELESLRPLVNERDLGRIRDRGQSGAIRAWLDDHAGRSMRETRERPPVQVRIGYQGPIAVRHILLHHRGRGAR